MKIASGTTEALDALEEGEMEVIFIELPDNVEDLDYIERIDHIAEWLKQGAIDADHSTKRLGGNPGRRQDCTADVFSDLSRVIQSCETRQILTTLEYWLGKGVSFKPATSDPDAEIAANLAKRWFKSVTKDVQKVNRGSH